MSLLGIISLSLRDFFLFLRRYGLLVLLPLLGALLVGCDAAHATDLPYVDLSERAPAPIPVPGKGKALHLAVASIVSPQGSIESYQNLADYLAKQLNRDVVIVQRRTYAGVNQLVAEKKVDLAFVCTSAYVDGHDKFGMELLVAPQIEGKTVYHSDLIVPADSDARGISDLRDKVFAFTDPMSFTGRVYPTFLLYQLGERPDVFFSRTFFTYSHDKAIQAVANGVADGAAVDSIVLEYAIKRDPSLQNRIRIIRHSSAFGIPPVVAPPGLSNTEKQRLKEVLLAMYEVPEGREVLDALGIDRFVPISDEAYRQARSLIRAMNLSFQE